MYRQGDVLLVQVDAVPSPAGHMEGPVSLHPGKTSRHFHAVRGEGIEAFMSRGDMFLRVAGSATLTHPDHAPLTVPAGTYRVARQREYGDDRARPMFSIGVPD